MNIKFSAAPVLAGLLSLLPLAAGCAGGQMTALPNHAAFQKVVLGADKPVLVEFYKGACPTCILLDGPMDKLAQEYQGRVVVAKYQLMTSYFWGKDKQVKDAYDISVFPTVVLFVNGQAVKTWPMHYGLKEYRQAIDAALGSTTAPATATVAGSQPAMQP
jgi:thioredoxin 1